MALNDVATLTGIMRYRIEYAVRMGRVKLTPREYKRQHGAYTAEDVKSICRHFGVAVPGEIRGPDKTFESGLKLGRTRGFVRAS